MFYIIGNLNAKDRNVWRVIDTEDSVCTDIAEDELMKLMIGGIKIENAKIVNDRLQGEVYGLDRYGVVGGAKVYTIIETNEDMYTVADQEGKVTKLSGDEIIRLATQYTIANCRLKCLRMPKGYREYIEVGKDGTIPLGKFKLFIEINNGISVDAEIIADNIGKYFLNFEHGGLDYSVLLHRCINSINSFSYYFGILERFDIQSELWDILESKEIGMEPHVAIIVEYGGKYSKFTKGVMVVNANRGELHMLHMSSRGKFKLKCEYFDTEEGISGKYISEVDLVKNKIIYS